MLNKKNSKVLMALLASTLLVGCQENTNVQNGSDPIGHAGDNATILDLQSFYEDLKTNSGGSKAAELLLKRMFELEYADGIQNGFGEDEIIKGYRTLEKFNEQINDYFQDIIDSHTYDDNDGDFDANYYKDYIEEAFDYTLTAGASSYITDDTLNDTLGYNYDEFIKDEVIPDIYEEYVYQDYVLGSSKYKGQFANQHAMIFESLKVPYKTDKENNNFTEGFIRDIKAVTTGANAESTYNFGTNYSFVTSNHKGQLIVFETTADALTYTIYGDEVGSTAIEDFLDDTYYSHPNIDNLTVANVASIIASASEVSSWTIDRTTTATSTFMENIEEVLVARDLLDIDRQVILARHYDSQDDTYKSWTAGEKSTASSYSDTLSSSGSRSIKEGAKKSKISASHNSYHYDKEAYVESSFSRALPSSIYNLRGSTAKELLTNLVEYQNINYLLPQKENMESPVYLDTSSSNYYICQVSDWYGYYVTNGASYEKNSLYKSIPNFQINAYQDGFYNEWVLNSEGSSYVVEAGTDGHVIDYKTQDNQDIIDLCQVSVKSILSSSMKAEAVLKLLEKYEIEVNDPDVLSYLTSQYPDYFSK